MGNYIEVKADYRQLIKNNFTGSFSKIARPSSALDKLLRTQVLMLAGDSMVAIALAGSLFFDISLHAARPHVLLGLILTFVPFVVIAPAIGPILDSVDGMRKAMILVSGLGRCVLCFFMASDLKSLLLFPESFGLLVLSKVYGISKQSLVPEIASLDNKDHEAFLHANSTLNFYGALSGLVGSLVGISIWKFPGLGSPWVLRVDAVVFLTGALAGLAVPRQRTSRVSQATGGPLDKLHEPFEGPRVDTDPYGTPEVSSPKFQKRNYSYSRQAPKDGGKSGQVPAQSAHDGVDELDLQISHRPILNRITKRKMRRLFVAASAVAVMRCFVGFLEFMLIFTLRRDHYSLYWFAVVVGGLTVGSVLSNVVAPRLKASLAEEQILPVSLAAISAGAVVTLAIPGMITEAFLMFMVSLSTGVGKIAFDALVQRDTPQSRRGTSFARFETRFQLVWVLGAIVPVAFSIPITWGDVAIGAVGLVSAGAYLLRMRASKRP